MKLKLFSMIILAAQAFATQSFAAQSIPASASVEGSARCLAVMSYHPGYAWNDGVEEGIRAGLGDACELKVFYMDTKRNKDKAFAMAKALEARALIESYKPGVVIAVDDNASRYLVQPYFKNAQLPFVFCGVNWSVDKYGYPYENVTGMIEVAPIQPLLETVKHVHADPRRALYIGANTFTEQKNFKRFKWIYGKQGVEVDGEFADTLRDWQAYYDAGQKYDFIILGSNAGIKEWDEKRAAAHALRKAGRLTVSNHHWMTPYTMYAMTKVPREHGEWSAEAARAILRGHAPSRIPIVVNRKWEIYINPSLTMAAGIELPRHKKAHIVSTPQKGKHVSARGK